MTDMEKITLTTRTRVDVVVVKLKEKVAEWVTILHGEGAPELADPDTFLGGLRDQFGDPAQIQWVTVKVQKIKQGSIPVTECIRDFRRIAGRLRHCPEQLLTQYF